MEMNKLKDIRLQQYLMNKKLMKSYSPYEDTDKDGFVNMMDCYPFDQSRHGFFGDTWRKVKRRFSPKPKETTTVIQQEKTAVHVKDIVKTDPTGKPVGGGAIVIKGPDAWKPSGGGGGGSSGTTVTYSTGGDLFESELKGIAEREKLVPSTRTLTEQEKLEQPSGVISGGGVTFTDTEIKERDRLKKEQQRAKFIERYWETPKKKYQETWEKLPRLDLAPTNYWGKSPTLITEEEDFPTKSTIIQAPPTTEELKKGKYFWAEKERGLTYEQILETKSLERTAKAEADRIANNVSNKAQSLADKKFNEIQKQVDSGKINVEKAQEKLDAYVGDLNKRTDKEFDYKFSKDMKPIVDASAKKLQVSRDKAIKEVKKIIDKDSLGLKATGGFITGLAYGGASVLFPPLGYGLLAGGGTYLATGGGKKIVEGFKEQPITTGVTLGSTVAGGIVGGSLVGYAKGSYLRTKTAEAIKHGKVTTKYTDITKTSQLKNLKLGVGEKMQIKTLIDRGQTVRLVTTKLKAGTGFEKYTPKATGKFVEVLSRNGKVVDRFSLGEVTATFRGKPLSAEVYNLAKGQISKGKIDYFSRTLTTKGSTLRYNAFTDKFYSQSGKPLSYIERIERAKILKYEKFPTKTFKIVGEAELKQLTKLTKQKYIKETSFRQPTLADIEMGRAWWKDTKLYGKADIKYVGQITDTQGVVSITTSSNVANVFLAGGKTDVGFGQSIFGRFLPKKTPRGGKTLPFNYPDTVKDITIPKRLANIIKAIKDPTTQTWAKGQVLAHYRTSGNWLSSGRIKAMVQQTGIEKLPTGSYGAIISQTLTSSIPNYGFSGALTGGLTGGLVGVSVTKVKTKPIQRLRIQQDNLSKLYSGQLTRLTSQTRIETRTATRLLTRQKLAQPQKSKQQPITRIRTQAPTTPAPYIPFKFTPYIPITGIEEEDEKKRKRKKQPDYFKKLKKAYQPSVGAWALGITAKKIPAKKFTGLGLRPVISKKRKGIKRKKTNYLQNVNKILG